MARVPESTVVYHSRDYLLPRGNTLHNAEILQSPYKNTDDYQSKEILVFIRRATVVIVQMFLRSRDAYLMSSLGRRQSVYIVIQIIIISVK